eukprot:gene16367-biopygen12059
MDEFTALLPKEKTVDCLEDLSALTVKELKHILVQYREKTSGVKADLVLRTYAVFCRAKNYDSSFNNILSESSLLCHEKDFTFDAMYDQCKHLPWTSDLRGTPAFSFLQLYEYLVIRTSNFKHILLKSTAYEKLKAFQFFFEGFIKKIDVAKSNAFTFFNVRIKASMKKVVYKVLVQLFNESGDVCFAACSCPAGIGLGGFGNCNHVGGVLFALEDFNRRGLQEFESAVSCTSKLSSWNVPNACSLRSFNPVPIDEIVIQKIKFGKTYDGKNVSSRDFDPRIVSDRLVDNTAFEVLKSKLAECLPDSGFFGFHPISASNLPSSSDTAFDSGDVSFNECYDISKPVFKEMMDIYSRKLSVSSQDISHIEKMTRRQSLNSSWMKHRLYRLTASNFYTAAVNTVEPSSKINSMFYTSFTTAATNHGKKFEGHVAELYRIFLKDCGINGIISETGLQLSSSFPYLGASLDGMVSSGSDRWGLEIKCPFSKFKSSLQDALKDKKFFLADSDGTIKLKRKHKYYYQVQGQMFCANLKRVDFVAWFGGSEPLFVDSITYDEDFVLEYMLPRLKFFYCRAILPEFFTRRVKHGFKLYLHGGWLSFDKVK